MTTTAPHTASPVLTPTPTRATHAAARASIAIAVIAVVAALVVVVAGLLVASTVVSSPGAGGAGPFAGTATTSDGADSHVDRGATGEAGGVVPDGTSVFDDRVPAVDGLDPRLLEAVRSAASDARADDVEFVVNSGWRSPAYQEQLLDEAVARYGSADEAARWVSTPATSAHVHGDAIDIGSWDATSWLSQHGAAYGLCQIYANESWHYELRPDAATAGCPAMFADPTEDPRMQR